MYGSASSSMHPVTIVARTFMQNDLLCIAGYDQIAQRLVRIHAESGQSYTVHAPFEVGQTWLIDYKSKVHLDPPHTEDVLVVKAYLANDYRVLDDFFRTAPVVNHVTDLHPLQLFDDKLVWIKNGRSLLSAAVEEESGVPPSSLLLWRADRKLDLWIDPRRTRSFYFEADLPEYRGKWKLPYKGTPYPPELIQPGTIVSLSLARWWPKSPGDPPRCYAQLCNVLT